MEFFVIVDEALLSAPFRVLEVESEMRTRDPSSKSGLGLIFYSPVLITVTLEECLLSARGRRK